MTHSLTENQASLADTLSTIVNSTASNKQSGVQILPSVQTEQPSELSGESCVDMFADRDDQGKWFVQKAKRRDNRSLRRIIGGNNSADMKVKAVVGRKEWHLFVGRLDPETDDVSDMLTSTNISVISCKMLKKTEAWHQKYAAFRVVVDVADKDSVFDELMMVFGADVQDWWSTSRQS